MADYFTKVIQMSQTLERVLETHYHAQGRGLHEKLSDVGDKIPVNIQKKIRYIATMRNKATHEDVRIAKENYASIRKAYNEVLPALTGGITFWSLLKRKLIFAAILMVFMLIWYLTHR